MERSKRRVRSLPDRELDNELLSAVLENDEKKVENLISRGADVNFVDASGTPLHIASYYGNGKIVKLLLKAGANPNAQEYRGKTPLIHACFGRHLNVVKMLLDAGADVNIESISGATAIKIALLFHEYQTVSTPEIVTMLLEGGAKVKLSDIEDASYVGNETYRIVKNAYLRQQLTPLLSASARGQVFDPRLYDRRLWRIVGKYVVE